MRLVRLAGVATLAAASLALVGRASDARVGDDFEGFVRPLLAANCVECHGGPRPKGRVDLAAVDSVRHLLDRPELIERLIDVVDASEMPPQEKPALGDADRAGLLASLKAMLRESAPDDSRAPLPIRRLNRFQYNNSVRDLFRLGIDVFRLPEKLMTREGDYLTRSAGRMPDRVEAACLSLEVGGGMREVDPFPKDLRAAHGYDNQANQLTLSPLLLDSFLRLGLSIVESPDFHEGTVGVWGELFQAPAEDVDVQAEVRRRLAPFLTRAFRRAIDDEGLDRYTAHVLSQLRQGLSFTDAMKKAAAAALCSPLFLYRYESAAGSQDPYALASDLSYFLWGSLPSLELLQLAESGQLSQPAVLSETLDGMLADPRIERFLDAFPSQWMQLENVLAATPDPEQHRSFRLDEAYPASLQMVLEPLLLFDAIFVEDRPVVELIAPEFGYESRFLDTWYRSDLRPPPLDEEQVAVENAARRARIAELETARDAVRAEVEALAAALPVRIRAALETLDLAPGQARWEAEQARILAVSVALSPWHRIGPFVAGNFDEAHATEFVDAAAIDLDQTLGEARWIEAPELVDGQGHPLTGANCATYLRRVVHCGSARPLEVSLGSDDSFKIWLNGELVAEKKVARGLAPDQDRVLLELVEGENELLMKVVNGGGGYGFYFEARASTLPEPVLAALRVPADERGPEDLLALDSYYHTVAPELAPVREEHAARTLALNDTLKEAEDALQRAPRPQTIEQLRQEAQRRFDDELRGMVRSRTFERVPVSDPRYGGVITNAAVLSMTSGPDRTHPIARGAWVIEVILNDPPAPPPNDVPPLLEEADTEHLTIRERFARHREDPSCAGCHASLDPLGFALENYGVTGRWRDVYENGRGVDPSGTLFRRHDFDGVVEFKRSLVREERRFAEAFTGHLLRFALSRELGPADAVTIEDILDEAAADGFRLRAILRAVAMSDGFRRAR